MSDLVRNLKANPVLATLVGLVLGAAIVVVVLLASSGSDDPSSTGTVDSSKAPFRVLFVTPLSGPLGFVGQVERNGYQAAANVVNREGGILGQRVSLKTVDDGGTGAKAVAAALKETNSTDYNLISCGSFGDDGLACAPAIASKPALQIPLIAEQQINDPEKFPRTFNSGGLFDSAEQGMAEKMRDDGIDRVAIVVGDNATGRTAAAILRRIAGQEGLTVTRTVVVPIGATSATPQLQQARASNPDAIAIAGFTPANIPILKARAALDWDVPVYGDWYFSSADLGAGLSNAEMEGITLQVWPFMVKDSEAQKTQAFTTMSDEFFKLQGDQMPLSITAALVAYNTLLLARAAAEKTDSVDGPAMAEALENINDAGEVQGFIGPKRLYTPEDHSWATQPSDFTYVNAGPTVNGYVVPNK